eukprot:SAG25_NODE_3431_length_1084_cov_2.039594_1_plen_83_part_00
MTETARSPKPDAWASNWALPYFDAAVARLPTRPHERNSRSVDGFVGRAQDDALGVVVVQLVGSLVLVRDHPLFHIKVGRLDN